MVVMHFGKSMLKTQHREMLQVMAEPERPLISKYLDLLGEVLVFQVSCELRPCLSVPGVQLPVVCVVFCFGVVHW